MLRLDLHIHTFHSYDGHFSVKEAVRVAKKKGLQGIAITDHDNINARKEIEKFSMRDFIIISGIEISSSDGHILGLGVEDLIPPKLSARTTVNRIKNQGGMAIAAHPFNPFVIGHSSNLIFKAKFDAIEAFNSRALFLANPLAKRFANINRLPIVSGSDAHYLDEIGEAYTILNCKADIDSIFEEIRRGGSSIFGQTLPLSRYLWRNLHKILHKI